MISIKTYLKSDSEYSAVRSRSRELSKSISTYIRDLIMKDLNLSEDPRLKVIEEISDEDLDFGSIHDDSSTTEEKKKPSTVEDLID